MSSTINRKISIELEIENVILNGDDILSDLSDIEFSIVVMEAQKEILHPTYPFSSGDVIFYMGLAGRSCEVRGFYRKEALECV